MYFGFYSNMEASKVVQNSLLEALHRFIYQIQGTQSIVNQKVVNGVQQTNPKQRQNRILKVRDVVRNMKQNRLGVQENWQYFATWLNT